MCALLTGAKLIIIGEDTTEADLRKT